MDVALSLVVIATGAVFVVVRQAGRARYKRDAEEILRELEEQSESLTLRLAALRRGSRPPCDHNSTREAWD